MPLRRKKAEPKRVAKKAAPKVEVVEAPVRDGGAAVSYVKSLTLKEIRRFG